MLKVFSKKENNFWFTYKNDLLQGISEEIQRKNEIAAGKLLFCAIDAMGLFYKGAFIKQGDWYVLPGGNGNPRSTNDEKSGSKDCFCNYLKNCWPEKLPTSFCKDILYEIYRCGLIHEGRPKKDYQISINEKFFIRKTLSILKGYELFLKSIDTFEKYLETESCRVNRWKARYDYMNKI